MADKPASTNSDRVVPFTPRRRSGHARPTPTQTAEPAPVDTESGDDGADDYRHRMKTNAAALVLLAALVWGGLWLAEKMAELRQNQDCVASGRLNCAAIVVPSPAR